MKNFCIAFCFAIVIYSTQALGSEAGMPQLNPEFWLSQIFWLLFIFSILYLIIWKVFLPRITYSIENRKSKIVNDLNETQKLKENAEKKLKKTAKYWKFIVVSKMFLNPKKKAVKKLKTNVVCRVENILNLK